MIRILIERLWPALLPLLIYWLWHQRRVAKCKKEGTTPPKLREGPWMQTLLAVFGIAAALLLLLGIAAPHNTGAAYVPAHIENGEIVKGHME